MICRKSVPRYLLVMEIVLSPRSEYMPSCRLANIYLNSNLDFVLNQGENICTNPDKKLG